MFYNRKQALVYLFLLLAAVNVLQGQTIVNTAPENRRAIVEEFGGIYCVYCPHGHEILTQLDSALGTDLIVLNYHSGPYANPIGDDLNLGNDYGDALYAQSELSGYPAATINRHAFPGLEQNAPGSTAIGRANWPEAVALILQESAPVNIAATADLNISNRQLELYIEYYYTADADMATNRLHVGVLQNNILAPQHGEEQGDHYHHQHVFREFITGQWGHVIHNTSEGTFGSFTYTFTLPAFYRDVWVDPANIELAVFITENEHEILNGVEVQPDLTSAFPTDANLLSIQAPNDLCTPQLTPDIRFRNDGNTPLESCTIRYGLVGGAVDSITWNGNLAPLEEAGIALPSLMLPNEPDNILFVELVAPNNISDPSSFNNLREHSFTLAPTAHDTNFELAIRTDEFGYELYWEVVDLNGNIYASGGNEVVGKTNGGAQVASVSDPGAYASNDFIIEEFVLPIENCYQLRVLDDYADGLCCFYGNGFYRLRHYDEPLLLEGSEFGALKESFFIVDFEVTSNNEVVVGDNPVRIYPNPLRRGLPLSISWPDTPPHTFSWQLIRADGRTLAIGDESALPDTTSLPNGYYLFELYFSEERMVFPIIVAD